MRHRLVKKLVRRGWKTATPPSRSADFGKVPDLKEIDEDIARSATPEAVRDAVVSYGRLSPELAKRFKKGRPLRARQLQSIAAVIPRAIHQVRTILGYFISAELASTSETGFRLEVRSTVLPKSDGIRGYGDLYLCMHAHYSYADRLAARMRLARLNIDGDERSVLVTAHVCERLEERAGIRGSHVAFLSYSVRNSNVRVYRGSKDDRMVGICDSQELLGFCPISESKKQFPLTRTRDVLRDAERLSSSARDAWKAEFRPQARWRLKTFLPSSFFREFDDGTFGPANDQAEAEIHSALS